MKAFSFYYLLLKTSLRASISRRGAFLMETSLMIVNNGIFFAIWLIFFDKFKKVGSWELVDMWALLAISTGAYGLMQILFGGVKFLSHMIAHGELDPYMTQPKNLLLHIISSKSQAKGWGHLLTTVLLLLLTDLGTPWNVLLVTICAITGCLVFAAFGVIVHSLPFWLGSVQGLSKKYFDSLYLFAAYPTNIYSGMLQIIMFTFIPAGIIGYLPVELVRNFSFEKLILLLFSALTFVAFAFGVFYAGLKRYESGNQFVVRH